MKILPSIILAAVIGCLAAVITMKAIAPQTAAQAESKTESAYDRVMRTGTIRCGYIHYEPYMIIDPATGKISGIYPDLMEEVGKRLSLKVEWAEEVGFGTAVEGLKTNRYDMVCSFMWASSTRARYADFSVPLNYSLINVWVRADDSRFDNDINLLDSPDYQFCTIEGSTEVRTIEHAFPKAKILALSNMTPVPEMFVNLVTKKADALLTDNAPAISFLKSNPGTIKNLTRKNPVRVNENVMLMPGGEYRFNQMINNAIRDIQYDGTFDGIVKKYDNSESQPRIAKPYDAGE